MVDVCSTLLSQVDEMFDQYLFEIISTKNVSFFFSLSLPLSPFSLSHYVASLLKRVIDLPIR